MTKKLQQKEYGISTFKGLVGAIPFAGTMLNELAFEARSRIKQERVNSFIEEFSQFMKQHSDNDLDLESLNVEQISDVFEEIVIAVSKTSAEHKKSVFKQILFKQLSLPLVDTDETLRFINITNELTNNQFKILSAFSSLSDNVLKYKIQILELQKEREDLYREIRSKDPKVFEQMEKLMLRKSKIPGLIKRKRNALRNGKVNPNYHTTFDLERKIYISEIQDLIAKGLLFDFVLKSQIIDPFVHFGITSLGRSYMSYISD